MADDMEETNFEIHNETNSNKQSVALAQKFQNFVTNISIEPVVVLYILPNMMAGLTMQNLTLDKACRVNLKLPEETCDALSSRNATAYSKDDEIAVQQLVASMYIWKTFLQSIIPAMMLLFLGSWSDRHGKRKPFILFPVLGQVITCVGFLFCTYFFHEFPMEVNGVVEALPIAITGGWYTMFMASYSYIAGICTVDSRTTRIGVVHLINDISITMGVALSGILFTAAGFYGVFLLCLVLSFAGLMYGYFRINENVADVDLVESTTLAKTNTAGFLKDLFNLKYLKDTLMVVFLSGKNRRKLKICLILVLVIITNGPLHGEMGVMYLYVRYRFNWNEVDYSIYATYKVLSQLFGTTLALLFFTKCLKLNDALIGLIATISRVCSCFLYAFASTVPLFYFAPVVEILAGTSSIAVRSIISKLVRPDELGKINSIFGVCEALLPLMYGPLYSVLYKATIEIFPGTFFLVGGFLTLSALFIFIWLYTTHKNEAAEALKNQELLQ